MDKPIDDADVYWNSFIVLIFEKITRNMKKDINTEVSKYGLTSAQVPYIIALTINDGQTMMSLSSFLDMDVANTSRMVRSMVAKGIVTQPKPHESSRRYPVYLTECGSEIGEHLIDFAARSIERYFDGVPKEDYVRVRNNLIRLFRNIMESSTSDTESEEQARSNSVSTISEKNIF